MVKNIYTLNNYVSESSSGKITTIIETKFSVQPLKIISIKQINYKKSKSVVHKSKIPNFKLNLDRLRKFLFKITNSPCVRGVWIITPEFSSEDVEAIKKLYLLTNF